ASIRPEPSSEVVTLAPTFLRLALIAGWTVSRERISPSFTPAHGRITSYFCGPDCSGAAVCFLAMIYPLRQVGAVDDTTQTGRIVFHLQAHRGHAAEVVVGLRQRARQRQSADRHTDQRRDDVAITNIAQELVAGQGERRTDVADANEAQQVVADGAHSHAVLHVDLA